MISSPSNALVKRIRRLQEKRSYRRKEGAFFVEGLPLVAMAMERRVPVEMVVFCEKLLVDETARRILVRQHARGTPCVAASEAVFRNISQRNNPDGLAALAETTWQDLDALVVKPTDMFAAIVEASDPGNLGTILRSMDAVGAAGLILVGQSTDAFHPRAVRASRGAIFTVSVSHVPDMDTLCRWARANHIHTIATSASADRSFRHASYRLPALVLLGNEHRGLSRPTMAAADQLVAIPMQGATSSLNVAVAASLVLCELRRTAQGRDDPKATQDGTTGSRGHP